MLDGGTAFFWSKIKSFSRSEKQKVLAIAIASREGASNLSNYTVPGSLLPVRNKDSSNVDHDDPEFLLKVQHAQRHNLWHIHAGFYNLGNIYPIHNGYRVSNAGTDLVSQWMLHYKNIDNTVEFVDASAHPLDIFSIKTS